MSKFTTEVRFICQTWTDKPDATIDEIVDTAAPHIFNDWWNAGDDEHTKELQRKILRHYYTQEIGYETVGLWKLRLNQTLAEIMPKYNVLYSNLTKIKDKLFNSADWWETSSGQSTAHSETVADNTSTSDAKTTGTSTEKSDATQNATNTSKTDGTTQSESWQKYNDTPQGAVTGLENDTYLTNATKNVSDATSNSNTSGSSEATTGTNTESTTGSDSSVKQTGTSTTTGDTSGTNDITRHVSGKNSGGDYLTQYLQLQQNYNDIDQLVIADLQPLFMGLWE